MSPADKARTTVLVFEITASHEVVEAVISDPGSKGS